ncbi:MAG: hypothetical protein N4A40_00750 [Tissierellales bacterium]|jgi:hypothetical protein|nr:hypothetical protein [Tissierellales bacterium]
MSEDQKSNEKRVLKIRLGEEYKPVVEDYTRAKESYFRGIYEKGIRIVKDIVDDRNIENQIDSEDNYYNNIIAFVGDRGMGKTSCMKSFEKLLTSNNKFFSMGFKEGESSSYNESSSKFYSMGTIDPSLFDKQNNLLEVVIAKMFERFKEAMENNQNCNNRNENNRRELIKQFSTIHENLKSLYSEEKSKDECDDIDELIKKAESIKLKENIANLVQNFLSFIGRGEDVKFLILIDDIDLNTEHAYKMAEQIRKYLIIPKVVILMAVKINQLSDAVEQNLIKANKELLKQERIDHQEIAVMTEKYLEKLIPVDRRLYLPDLNDLEIKIPLEIEDGNFKAETVEFGVRELICTRTGMYFQKYEQRPNYIVPKNFRELIDLITMLYKMEPVRRTAKSICMEILQSGFVPASASKLQYKWEEKDFDKKYLFVNDLIDFEEEELENICTWGAGESEEIGSNLKYFTDQILRKSDEDKKETDENKDQKNAEKILSFSVSFDQLKQAVKNIKKEKQNRDKEITRQKQLGTFKDYFLNSWCNYHLKREHNEIIKGFMSMTVSEKNKYIIRRLDESFKLTERDNKNDNRGNKKVRDAYKDILDHDNTSINISLGDVLFVLERCEKIATEYIEIQFIFAIKTIYSILMNQYKKEELMENDYNLSNKKAYSRYDRLIGGSIHLSKVNPILEDDWFYQDEKIIDYKKLCRYYKENIEGQFIALFIKSFGLEKLEDNYYLDQEAYYDAKRLLKNPERVGINLFSGFLNIANVGILEENNILKGKSLGNIWKYAGNPVYFGNIEMIEDLRAYDIKNKIREELIIEKTTTGEYWIKYLEKMREYRLDSSIVSVTFRNNGIFRILDEIIKNNNGTTKLENIINKILKDKELLVEEMRKNKNNFSDLKLFFENYQRQLELLDIKEFASIKENISRYRTKEELIYDIDKEVCTRRVEGTQAKDIANNFNGKIYENIKRIESTKKRVQNQIEILEKRSLEIKHFGELSKNKMREYELSKAEISEKKDKSREDEIKINKLAVFKEREEVWKKIEKEKEEKFSELEVWKEDKKKTNDEIGVLKEKIRRIVEEKNQLDKQKEEINNKCEELKYEAQLTEDLINEKYTEVGKKDNELHELLESTKHCEKKLESGINLKEVIEREIDRVKNKIELKSQFHKNIEEIRTIMRREDSIEVLFSDDEIKSIKNGVEVIVKELENIPVELINAESIERFKKIAEIIISKEEISKVMLDELGKSVENIERLENTDMFSSSLEELHQNVDANSEDILFNKSNLVKLKDKKETIETEMNQIEKQIEQARLKVTQNLEIQKNYREEKNYIDLKQSKLDFEKQKLIQEFNNRENYLKNVISEFEKCEGELISIEDNIKVIREKFFVYKKELSNEIEDFQDLFVENVLKDEIVEEKRYYLEMLEQSIVNLESKMTEMKEELKSNQNKILFQRTQMGTNYKTIKELFKDQETKSDKLLVEKGKFLETVEAEFKDSVKKQFIDNGMRDFNEFKVRIEQKINEAQQLEDDIELQLIEVELITQG